MMAALAFSQGPFGKLLQNSDLPQPAKIFKREKESQLQSPAIYNNETEGGGVLQDKLGLLKALRLSQTRAREAEKKASLLCIEKEHVAALFLRESSRLFAHRQWVKLLEMEVSHLRSQLASSCLQEEKQLEEKAEDGCSNWWALALWLGIASVGLGLSCRCLFCNNREATWL